jgi:predicted transcriptional regulator of viral defense system
MRRREWDTKLYNIAEAQLGFFSTAQAREAGINPIRLLQLVKSEDIERVSRAVYRLTRFPISPLGQYMEATLWPQVRRPDMWAVLSHESALSLYELSDASPSTVHITLPSTVRIRRAVPKHLTIHRAALEARDVKIVEGIRVTTPERTILDVHADHIGRALVRQAIIDGRRTGQLTLDQAERLQHEIVGDEATVSGPR